MPENEAKPLRRAARAETPAAEPAAVVVLKPAVAEPATAMVIAEPGHAHGPEAVEANFFAALPFAFQASVTEMHVEAIAGEAPSSAEPTHIEPSLADVTVAEAPASDPFLDELFGALAQPTAVHPEDIPLAGVGQGGRRAARGKRSRTKKPLGARRPAAKTVTAKRAPAGKARPAPRAPKPVQHPRAAAAKPASRVLSTIAMLFVAALFVGMTVPANAFITFAAEEPGVSASVSAAASLPSQVVEVSTEATVTAPARDAFSITTRAQVIKAKYGTRVFSYSPTAGPVRWPFPYATPVSSGYGDRKAPCRGCSSYHNGVDFTPGSGTPIYAIADGVVTLRDDDSSGFGNHAYISHVIDGHEVESIYAHMLSGSSPLVEGETVRVGDLVGLVGNTGTSTGSHLHLEIHVDGSAVDPFAWLTVNARN